MDIGAPSDEHFMKQALIEAQSAYHADEVPVGAVVVCEGRIIARAHNLPERITDVTAHAEMQAITAAADFIGGKFLHQCAMYVTLEPCGMCAGAIGWARFGKLVYGAEDPKKGYTTFSHRLLHPTTRVLSGVLAQESAELLQGFFQRKRLK